jgi:hypothetical protein
VDRLVREHAVVASVLRNSSRSGIWIASMVWLC